jgi:hypothetical protein
MKFLQCLMACAEKSPLVPTGRGAFPELGVCLEVICITSTVFHAGWAFQGIYPGWHGSGGQPPLVRCASARIDTRRFGVKPEFIPATSAFLGTSSGARSGVNSSASRRRVIGMATTCEEKSFGVECSDWIDPHGAERRDIAGGERDSGK